MERVCTRNMERNGKEYKLVDAIHLENSVLLSQLLERFDAKCEDARLEAGAALKHAAERDYQEGAEILLVAGVDPNWADVLELEIPLTAAAAGQHLAMAELLLKHGANVDGRNSYGSTALHKAVVKRNLDCVDLLLRHKANCNAVDAAGNTPIILASEANDPEPMATLIRHCKALDINHKNNQDTSALQVAVERNTLHIVKLLLGVGADPNIGDGDYRTCLHKACLRGHHEILALLLKMGGNPNLEDRVHHTPIFEASWQGHYKCIELLIEFGAEVDVLDRSDYFPLAFAALNGHKSVVELLLDAGCKINRQGYLKNTALHEATWNGWEKTVKYLLQRGANPNLQDINGATPLFKSLLKRDLNLRDFNTWKILLHYNTDLELRGRSMYIQDGIEYTPLQLALIIGHVPAARMLLLAGSSTASVQPWFLFHRVPTRLRRDPMHCDFIKQVCLNARGLKQLCRRCVRRAMGQRLPARVADLPIPRAIQEYVTLAELNEMNLDKFSDIYPIPGIVADIFHGTP